MERAIAGAFFFVAMLVNSSYADVTLPPPTFDNVVVTSDNIIVHWRWEADIWSRCYFQVNAPPSYEKLQIHYGGDVHEFELKPEGNGNVEDADFGTVTLNRTTGSADIVLRMRVVPTVWSRAEGDHCSPSKFVTWSNTPQVPQVDPPWCPVDPKSTCQTSVTAGGSSLYPARVCESCDPACDAALQKLQKEINKVPYRIKFTLCKIPVLCDDLMSIHTDLSNAMWDAADRCLVDPLMNLSPFVRFASDTHDVLADVTVASSDPSVLEITDTGGDSFTLEKRRSGTVAWQMSGASHSGQVATASSHMDIGAAVPTLPVVGLAMLAAVLAATAMRCKSER